MLRGTVPSQSALAEYVISSSPTRLTRVLGSTRERVEMVAARFGRTFLSRVKVDCVRCVQAADTGGEVKRLLLLPSTLCLEAVRPNPR